MRLFRSTDGWWIERGGLFARLNSFDLDEWLSSPDPVGAIRILVSAHTPAGTEAPPALLPMGSQEVWAAGVTYLRSKSARMEESAAAASLYDRVYEAVRPELFFKATACRCVGHGEALKLRDDTRWIVPEPELTLVISSAGRIVGFTIGNDMSCRDIEGENALYLPQAKIWDRCCSLGPAILVNEGVDDLLLSAITMCIRRGDRVAFAGATHLSRMKRTPDELVSWLFRNQSFPKGVFLLTGTGVVPEEGFTLVAGDEIEMTVPEIGTLINRVE
ncbi:MAG: fumarylacetoacetate hydrolase family protein [Tepidisphaerales bacterium]